METPCPVPAGSRCGLRSAEARGHRTLPVTAHSPAAPGSLHSCPSPGNFLPSCDLEAWGACCEARCGGFNAGAMRMQGGEAEVQGYKVTKGMTLFPTCKVASLGCSEPQFLHWHTVKSGSPHPRAVLGITGCPPRPHGCAVLLASWSQQDSNCHPAPGLLPLAHNRSSPQHRSSTPFQVRDPDPRAPVVAALLGRGVGMLGPLRHHPHVFPPSIPPR